MDAIEQLVKRLEIMSNEFQSLIKENRALKAHIKMLEDKNDVITRNNQDMILTIKNRLKKDHNINIEQTSANKPEEEHIRESMEG